MPRPWPPCKRENSGCGWPMGKSLKAKPSRAPNDTPNNRFGPRRSPIILRSWASAEGFLIRTLGNVAGPNIHLRCIRHRAQRRYALGPMTGERHNTALRYVAGQTLSQLGPMGKPSLRSAWTSAFSGCFSEGGMLTARVLPTVHVVVLLEGRNSCERRRFDLDVLSESVRSTTS